MNRTLYILGAFGKIADALLSSKIKSLSSLYFKIYLIDIASPSDSLRQKIPHNCEIVNSDVKSWIESFKPHGSSDFLLTIGKDYPVSSLSRLPECVFHKNYDEFLADFYLNAGYLYDILSKCEQAFVKDMTFISFDSIYSDTAPNRSLYDGGLKPIIYGLGKSQLSLIAKCVRQNFHFDQWYFYNLKLGAVAEVGLSDEFIDKYKHIMSSVDSTSISSVIDVACFLLSFRPSSLSGSTLDLTLHNT